MFELPIYSVEVGQTVLPPLERYILRGHSLFLWNFNGWVASYFKTYG